MILPRPRAIIRRATAWPTKKAVSMLVRISSDHFSIGKSSSGVRNCMPALFTRMPIGPDLRLHGLDAGRDRRGVGGVEGRHVDRDPLARQDRGRLGQPRLVPPVQHDAGPGAAEGAGDAEADALGGARDERDAAREVEEGRHCGERPESWTICLYLRRSAAAKLAKASGVFGAATAPTAFSFSSTAGVE